MVGPGAAPQWICQELWELGLGVLKDFLVCLKL